MDKDTIYLVSGFMRTGTSMMMKALDEGGMEMEHNLKREEMRKSHADENYDPNEGGLYELHRSEYQDETFPDKYYGKVIKGLGQCGVRMKPVKKMKVIFMRRSAEEIRQSYQAFFGSPFQNFDMENFQKNMDHNIAMMRNRRDVESVTEIWFKDVVKDPIVEFQKIKDAGWNIDVDKAASVVKPELYRFKEKDLVKGII